MLFLSVMHDYLLWHYSRAFMEIFHIWLNFLWFIVHFFSLPQLMRTWIAPWKRTTEHRGNKWNFEDLAGYLIIGLISRVVGFTFRTIVIMTGFIALFFTVVVGFLTYIFWLFAPLIIIFLFGAGLTLLFT